MMVKGAPIIIVKKRPKHEGHHGGAWKVAYADFVTAMMAFFLVMWLVNQSKSVKSAIGGYFRDPGVFESKGGKGILPGDASINDTPPPPGAVSPDAERQRLEAVVGHIRERLDQVPEFKTLRNQIEFSVTPEGLRVDLVEAEKSSFFDSGSAVLRGEAERILGVIARELGALKHQVVIEGHTDSRQYASAVGYTNWELSADRANAARRVMERQGLTMGQVASVRGEADRQLRNPKDPFDPRNRRVSIVVRNPLPPADKGADKGDKGSS
jgi:chemotaxis protein MotB